MQGNKVIRKPFGAAPLVSEIPIVKPNKGYRFTGWDVDPFAALTNNKVCVAQYEKILPWYKRWRLWTTGFFSSKGCLKWLLWMLLIILLLVVFMVFTRCDGVVLVDRNGNAVLPNYKADKIEQVAKPDGTIMTQWKYKQYCWQCWTFTCKLALFHPYWQVGIMPPIVV